MNEPLPGRAKSKPSPAQLEAEGSGFMDFMAEHTAFTAGKK